MTLDTTAAHRPRLVAAIAAMVAAAAALLALATSASAQFGVTPGSFQTTLSTTQAGGHPDLTTTFAIPRDGTGDVSGSLRSFKLDLPPGFVGDPNATPKCTMGQVLNAGVGAPCPLGTAVGRVAVRLGFPGLPGFEQELNALIYNVEQLSDQPASFGFSTAFNSRLDAEVRSDGDYGVTVRVKAITEAVSVLGVTTTLWGVPADHNGPGSEFDMSTQRPYGGPGDGVRRAFLTNPTSCTGAPQPVTMEATSWQEPTTVVSATTTLDQLTGCGALSFEPSVRVRPDTAQAGAPAGYDIDVDVPQSDNPDAPATAHLEDATVVLPEGVALSPSVGSGLAACTDAQLGRGSRDAPVCPANSRVGSVSITSPLLDAPMTGDVFVGEPLPGNRYRLFLSAYGQGVGVKLEGRVTPDPVTGQLTTTFLDNPQLPFSNLHIELDGGPRAPLANPRTCGLKTTTAELASYSGIVSTVDDSFAVTGCGDAFSPTWTAGSVNAIAGKASPFAMEVARTDADQEIDRIAVDLPKGLLGHISKVSECTSAAAAAAACPASSRIGTVTSGAGAGSDPLYLKGGIYLTEGYRGAPFGLSFVVPAIAGPYDLGVVNVRAPIRVDPDTAQLSVVSDPLPRILEGVPLRIRSVAVEIDRPGFMVNPTSCADKRIEGEITSTAGRTAEVGTRFQVGECASLGYAPKLRLGLVGKRQTKPGSHPGLRATLTQRRGQANNRQIEVRLPKSLALDPANANALCGYEAGLAADCPAASKIGTASARTPMLDRPLKGPVYFVQGVRFDRETGQRIRTLPTLLVKLRGQVEIHLRARSSVESGHLVSTFRSIPDAPVTRFDMRLKAGDGGILAVTGERNLCSQGRSAQVDGRGQNGRRFSDVTRMETPCPRRGR